MGEHRLRDLNDEINKKMREKRHWERQIKALGGGDYPSGTLRLGDAGVQVPGGGGYRYFGAAKDLPGVKELFAAVRWPTVAVVPWVVCVTLRCTGFQAESVVPRRTRDQISKRVDIDYFGFRDEEDDELLEAEAVAEQAGRCGCGPLRVITTACTLLTRCFCPFTARSVAVEAWERDRLERKLAGTLVEDEDEGDCFFEEGMDIEEATQKAAEAAAAAELQHRKEVRGLLRAHAHVPFAVVRHRTRCGLALSQTLLKELSVGSAGAFGSVA